MKFLNSNFTLDESNVVVFGVPLGKSSNNTLKSLRYISQFVEPMDLHYDKNLLENVKTNDIGNIKLKSLDEITKQTKKILDMNKIPLILGGNHLLSYYSLRAFENVKLIVFDAHGDFKDSYDDEKIRSMNLVKGIKYNPRFCDASWLRRISEIIPPKNIMLLGVRSCDEFEFNDLKKSGIKFFTSRKMIEDRKQVIKEIEQFSKNSNVYISLDVDVFDPSVFPAVDMAEPDGIFFNDFQSSVKSIKGKVIGIDVCCLSPIKGNEISEFLAVRSVIEMLNLI